jgi:hypothetical protein
MKALFELSLVLTLDHLHELLRVICDRVDVKAVDLNHLHEQVFEFGNVHLLQISLMRKEHLTGCRLLLILLSILVLGVRLVLLVLELTLGLERLLVGWLV